MALSACPESDSGFLERFEGVVRHVQSLEGLGHSIARFHRLRIEFHHATIETDRLVVLALLHVDVGEKKVGLEVVRVEFDGLFEFASRLLRPAGSEIGTPEIEVILSVVRLQFHGFSVGVDGELGLVEFVSHQA